MITFTKSRRANRVWPYINYVNEVKQIKIINKRERQFVTKNEYSIARLIETA
jgi:hypothetical protein